MKKILTLLLLSALVFYSCKREQRDYGGVTDKNSDLPKTEVLASNYAAPSDGMIADLNVKEALKVTPQQMFITNCSACHQATGKGIPGAFPPLDGSPYVTSDNVERLAAIMVYGLQGPIKVLGKDYNGVMAPLGATCDDQTLADIATYVRSSWSNKASKVTADVIANARKKYGSRSMFNIDELGREE